MEDCSGGYLSRLRSKNFFSSDLNPYISFQVLWFGVGFYESLVIMESPLKKNNVFLVVKMHNLYKTTCYLRLRISKILNQGLNL